MAMGTWHKRQDDIDFVGDGKGRGGNDPRNIPDSRQSEVVRYYEEGYICGSIIAETAIGSILDFPLANCFISPLSRDHIHIFF